MLDEARSSRSSQGKHKLVVEATDAAGNSADATYKWKVKKQEGP